jgi:hypothetical protein
LTQSHLDRHFQRIMGVSPKMVLRSGKNVQKEGKNVQDKQDPAMACSP